MSLGSMVNGKRTIVSARVVAMMACALLSVAGARTGIAASASTLAVSPTSLSFAYQIGGPLPAAQSISVAGGDSMLSFTASAAGASWLTALPVSGTTPGTVTVSIAPWGMGAGTYSGQVIVASAGADNSPQYVTVNLTVIDPAAFQLTAQPGALTFSFASGSTIPAPQSVSITGNGPALSYSASISGGAWLAVTASGGTAPGSIGISVDPTGLAPGRYNASVVISIDGSGAAPLSVPVQLDIAAAPLVNLTVTPVALSFTYQIGGVMPAPQTISVAGGGSALPFTASASGGGWLTALPVNGTTPGSISISISPQGLSVGSYSGGVIIAAGGAVNSPQIVTVNLTVSDPSAPQLTASPAVLAFNYSIGDNLPPVQTVSVLSGGTSLGDSVSASDSTWMMVMPPPDGNSGSVGVSVDSTGLAAGTYSGIVSIAAPGTGNSPLTVPVSMTISSGLPNLTATPTALSFTYQIGSATPAPQTISVSSSGAAIAYSASASGSSWLNALPVNGSTPATVSVSISPVGLVAGVYSGEVIVASAGAGNGPQIVSVSLVVTNPAASQLTAAPASLTFNYTLGSSVPAAQNLAIGSTGAALAYTVSTSVSGWLAVTPSGGTTSGSVIVSINPAGLAAGTYTGSVIVTATGAGNSPLIVPVGLNISSTSTSTLTVAPAVLAFTYQIGGAVPAAQTVSVTSSSLVLTYTASASGDSWLIALPVYGSTPGTFSASVSPAGLAAGLYSGTVIVATVGASNSPQVIPVYLTVTAATPPTLSAAPTAIAFSYQTGTGAPAAQLLSISSSSSVLRYTVTASGGTWLAVTPATGLTPGGVGLSVNVSGLAVGTYSGSVTISAPGASNLPLTVPVTLTITLGNLTAVPPTLSFSWILGATAPAAQSFVLDSSGSALNFTVTPSATWLVAAPTSGTTPGTINVSINTTGLAVGTYSGSLSIAATGAGNAPFSVPVTLTVTSPSLATSATSAAFTYTLGGTAPGALTVSVTSNGAALSYTVTKSASTWLNVTPATGTTPGNISISVTTTGLAAGTYSGSVTLTATGAGNSPLSVPVTLTVSNPSLTTTPATLTFAYSITTATLPTAQSVSITSNGTALAYTVTPSAAWLIAAPTSGNTTSSISVSINPTGLVAGTYTGTLSVAATGAANSPRTVTVTLTVSP